MAKDSESMPKKILVAVEGSEPSLKESSMKAARYALKLATTNSATVIAICVVQIPDYVEEATRAILKEELFTKSAKTLDEIHGIALSSSVSFFSKTIETSGSISGTICNFADREGVDLITLGTRANTSNLTKMMLGSVAAGVVGNASCPVLVVR